MALSLGIGIGMPFASAPGGGFAGPLDDYTANLLDAFSPEFRLLSSYEGSAFNVRRSSDSAALDIGFTAGGTLDEAAFTAHVGGGTGYMAALYNQAGGSNYSNATATQQAKLNIAAAGTGSRANFELDATNDQYPSIRTLTKPFTIYLVECPKVNAVNTRTIGGTSPNNSLISAGRNDGNSCYLSQSVSTYSAATNTLVLSVLVCPASGAPSFYSNGVNRTRGGVGAGANFGSTGLGWAAAEQGNTVVCELLIYGAAHDATTMEAIDAILRNLRGFGPV